MYQVAMIGAGIISEWHAEALKKLHKRVRVVAVADLDQAAAESVANDFEAAVYADYGRLLDEQQVDIALICLPHHLHLHAGLSALNAGAHLFLEKPMALSVQECRQLIEKAETIERTLFVGHTHQYRSNFRCAKKLIEQGEIGDVRLIFDEMSSYYSYETRKSWFLDPQSAGGGPLFNATPHQIDHLLHMTGGTRVTAVRAAVVSLRDGYDIDSDLFAFIEFENGVRATVATFGGTRIEDPPRLQCKVVGCKGSLSISAFQPEVILAKKDSREIIACVDGENPIQREWEELLDALKERRQPQTDGIYGHNVIAILEAMRRSHLSGGEEAPDLL